MFLQVVTSRLFRGTTEKLLYLDATNKCVFFALYFEHLSDYINKKGEISLGYEIECSSVPRLVMKAEIKSVSCGSDFMFLLTSKGKLFVCGSNRVGQIGLGNETLKSSRLTLLMEDEEIETVSCGHFSSFIIKKDGEVLACGLNNFCKLYNFYFQLNTN